MLYFFHNTFHSTGRHMMSTTVETTHTSSTNPTSLYPWPTTQSAIVGREDGSLGISDNVPLPDLEDDLVLVKVTAVALNPVDYKMTGHLGNPHAVAGHDFAGVVVAAGRLAAAPGAGQVFATGDRVCSAVIGMNALAPRIGAFSQYVAAAGHVLLKIPPAMSMEEGATLGIGLATVGAAFRSLQLPGFPLDPAPTPKYVLVYGGSTATGTLAIQLLRLCVNLIPFSLLPVLVKGPPIYYIYLT